MEGDFANAVGGWEEPLLEGRYYFFGFMLIAGSNVDGAVTAGEEVGGFYADTGGGAISGGRHFSFRCPRQGGWMLIEDIPSDNSYLSSKVRDIVDFEGSGHCFTIIPQ